MGCFLRCFRASKRPKHIHSANTTPSTHHTHVADAHLKVTEVTEQKIIEESISDTLLKIKLEDGSNGSGIKKFTSDLNVNATKELSTKEVEESSVEPEKAGEEEAPQTNDGPKAIADNLEEEKKSEEEEESEGKVNGKSLPEESSDSLFSLSLGSRKQVTATEKAENEVNSPMPLGGEESHHENVWLGLNPIENLALGETMKETSKENLNLFKTKLEGSSNCIAKRKVNFYLNVHTNQESSSKDLRERLKEEQEETPERSECIKSRASEKSSGASHYRYRDWSDEECGDFDLNDNGTWAPEESSESLFSLSTSSIKQVSAAQNEVDSPMPAREIDNSSSVLNSVENLTLGKVVKATGTRASKYEKENVDTVMRAEANLKISNGKARHKKLKDKNKDEIEIRVDTSLSSWLIETERTPKSKSRMNSVGNCTPLSHEDRPILGALSMEELRKYCVSTTPTPTPTPSRRCRSPSPEDAPIIGSVGSYWSHTHTGQTINSESSSC